MSILDCAAFGWRLGNEAGPTDVRRLDDRMMPVAGGDGMTMAAATKHKHLTLVSPEAQGDISET
ncbi:MAG TPA: hypothetical protein VNS22_14780, partial [Geminicoccus sp.]|uniref:hypothetical protein n=1 Tax=Geminicoccus sp. TaxID=2024832 RepID=UPI002BE5F0BB